MLALVSWIVFGLIVGALARLVLTGSEPMGWIATLALCVVGSVVGGFVGSMLWTGHIEFQPGGFFLSVFGAILLLLIVHKLGRAAVSWERVVLSPFCRLVWKGVVWVARGSNLHFSWDIPRSTREGESWRVSQVDGPDCREDPAHPNLLHYSSN